MNNTKKDLREEFMEFISQECYDLAKYKAGKYDNKIWRWIVKALQEAREEGWQIGHKQTKEDYQAKEEEVVGEIEKLKQQDEDNPFQTCFECESTMSIYGECPPVGVRLDMRIMTIIKQ